MLSLRRKLRLDTERMVLADVIYAAGEPAGWALIPEPTEKERRYCEKKNIQLIEADGFTTTSVATEVGC